MVFGYSTLAVQDLQYCTVRYSVVAWHDVRHCAVLCLTVGFIIVCNYKLLQKHLEPQAASERSSPLALPNQRGRGTMAAMRAAGTAATRGLQSRQGLSPAHTWSPLYTLPTARRAPLSC